MNIWILFKRKEDFKPGWHRILLRRSCWAGTPSWSGMSVESAFRWTGIHLRSCGRPWWWRSWGSSIKIFIINPEVFPYFTFSVKFLFFVYFNLVRRLYKVFRCMLSYIVLLKKNIKKLTMKWSFFAVTKLIFADLVLETFTLIMNIFWRRSELVSSKETWGRGL